MRRAYRRAVRYRSSALCAQCIRRSCPMKPTQTLHQMGQRLWLDNITRGLLRDGTLARYIEQYAVTGLTSNPTIFEQAIGGSDAYDDAIRAAAAAGHVGEELFLHLALQDLTEAAELFRPTFESSAGMDGWVSLELPPALADD